MEWQVKIDDGDDGGWKIIIMGKIVETKVVNNLEPYFY